MPNKQDGNRQQQFNNKMSEFEQYLVSEQQWGFSKQLKQPTKYIVIDSDNENNEYEYEQGLDSSDGKILANIDTNVSNSAVKDSSTCSRNRKCSTTWTNVGANADVGIRSSKGMSSRCSGGGKGVINKYIEDRKETRTRLHKLQLDINKIEMECESLQQLIEKVIKEQAELEVRKYKMRKEQNKTKQQKPEMKGQRVGASSESQHKNRGQLDINKTIKIHKSKLL